MATSRIITLPRNFLAGQAREAPLCGYIPANLGQAKGPASPAIDALGRNWTAPPRGSLVEGSIVGPLARTLATTSGP